VHLDAGYDSGKTRDTLAERGLHGEIARKGENAPIQATQRWHVERTNAWHNSFNRLQRCYERREAVVNAFFDLADAIITVRSLTVEPGPLTVGTPAPHADHDQHINPRDLLVGRDCWCIAGHTSAGIAVNARRSVARRPGDDHPFAGADTGCGNCRRRGGRCGRGARRGSDARDRRARRTATARLVAAAAHQAIACDDNEHEQEKKEQRAPEVYRCTAIGFVTCGRSAAPECLVDGNGAGAYVVRMCVRAGGRRPGCIPRRARRQRKDGLWAQDGTLRGVDGSSVSALEQGGVVVPKLFRR
jgi:hypothetical protein